jgi:hypothetical protein
MEHHVYFWLNEERQNEADRAEFEAGLESLLTLEGVVRGVWGVPAPVAPRPVLDLSWDYALSLTFASVAAHDVYQVDPAHKAFIEAFKPWWAQVRVTDLVAK